MVAFFVDTAGVHQPHIEVGISQIRITEAFLGDIPQGNHPAGSGQTGRRRSVFQTGCFSEPYNPAHQGKGMLFSAPSALW